MKKHQKTQIIKIGKLTFNLGASLGSGPKGSVYEGTYEDRKVAVKVYDGENYTFEESEKMTIHHFDTHKNIIKYGKTKAA